jgi:hypothetical protein
MPNKKTLEGSTRMLNESPQNLLKISIESLFTVLNAKNRTPGAKKNALPGWF